jgi:hypothetical protein
LLGIRRCRKSGLRGERKGKKKDKECVKKRFHNQKMISNLLSRWVFVDSYF